MPIARDGVTHHQNGEPKVVLCGSNKKSEKQTIPNQTKVDNYDRSGKANLSKLDLEIDTGANRGRENKDTNKEGE